MKNNQQYVVRRVPATLRAKEVEELLNQQYSRGYRLASINPTTSSMTIIVFELIKEEECL